MTWKVILAGALLASASPMICHSPERLARSNAGDPPTRQNVAAGQASPRQETADSPHAWRHRAKAAATRDAFDQDIPHQTIEFGAPDIERLLDTGRTWIDLAGLGTMELVLAEVRQARGSQIIRATHAGLSSTITRRGTRFFMSLATPDGAFRIEGQQHQTRVYPHRLLAQRSVRHAGDFRYVH